LKRFVPKQNAPFRDPRQVRSRARSACPGFGFNGRGKLNAVADVGSALIGTMRVFASVDNKPAPLSTAGIDDLHSCSLEQVRCADDSR
jgi:hypothetical protein